MKKTVVMKTDPVFFIAAVFFIRIYALFSFVALLSAFPLLQDSSLAPWILAAYPFAQAIGQIPCGLLADRYTPLVVIRYGLIVFALATLGCLIAPTPSVFLCARSIQGLCAIGAPAQSWLAMHASSSQHLQSRYYCIGAAIVAGLFCGFMSASVAQHFQIPSLVFWIMLGSVGGLIYQSYHFESTAEEWAHIQWSGWTYDYNIIMIFMANAVLHFLQSFILGGVHELCTQFSGYSSASVMSAGLVIAILLCADPLKYRQYQYSISFSAGLCVPIVMLGLWFFIQPMAQEPLAALLIVLIFSLLLLLESALPTGLKRQSQGTGLILGIYNTFQYIAMTIGSLLTVYANRGTYFFGISALFAAILLLILSQMRAQPR